MKWPLCLTLALLALALASPAVAKDPEVRMVMVMYRHGDRTPISTYPSDPYKDESNW